MAKGTAGKPVSKAGGKGKGGAKKAKEPVVVDSDVIQAAAPYFQALVGKETSEEELMKSVKGLSDFIVGLVKKDDKGVSYVLQRLLNGCVNSNKILMASYSSALVQVMLHSGLPVSELLALVDEVYPIRKTGADLRTLSGRVTIAMCLVRAGDVYVAEGMVEEKEDGEEESETEDDEATDDEDSLPPRAGELIEAGAELALNLCDPNICGRGSKALVGMLTTMFALSPSLHRYIAVESETDTAVIRSVRQRLVDNMTPVQRATAATEILGHTAEERSFTDFTSLVALLKAATVSEAEAEALLTSHWVVMSLLALLVNGHFTPHPDAKPTRARRGSATPPQSPRTRSRQREGLLGHRILPESTAAASSFTPSLTEAQRERIRADLITVLPRFARAVVEMASGVKTQLLLLVGRVLADLEGGEAPRPSARQDKLLHDPTLIDKGLVRRGIIPYTVCEDDSGVAEMRSRVVRILQGSLYPLDSENTTLLAGHMACRAALSGIMLAQRSEQARLNTACECMFAYASSIVNAHEVLGEEDSPDAPVEVNDEDLVVGLVMLLEKDNSSSRIGAESAVRLWGPSMTPQAVALMCDSCIYHVEEEDEDFDMEEESAEGEDMEVEEGEEGEEMEVEAEAESEEEEEEEGEAEATTTKVDTTGWYNTIPLSEADPSEIARYDAALSAILQNKYQSKDIERQNDRLRTRVAGLLKIVLGYNTPASYACIQPLVEGCLVRAPDGCDRVVRDAVAKANQLSLSILHTLVAPKRTHGAKGMADVTGCAYLVPLAEIEDEQEEMERLERIQNGEEAEKEESEAKETETEAEEEEEEEEGDMVECNFALEAFDQIQTLMHGPEYKLQGDVLEKLYVYLCKAISSTFQAQLHEYNLMHEALAAGKVEGDMTAEDIAEDLSLPSVLFYHSALVSSIEGLVVDACAKQPKFPISLLKRVGECSPICAHMVVFYTTQVLLRTKPAEGETSDDVCPYPASTFRREFLLTLLAPLMSKLHPSNTPDVALFIQDESLSMLDEGSKNNMNWMYGNIELMADVVADIKVCLDVTTALVAEKKTKRTKTLQKALNKVVVAAEKQFKVLAKAVEADKTRPNKEKDLKDIAEMQASLAELTAPAPKEETEADKPQQPKQKRTKKGGKKGKK
ncbi:hypothetical protein KIPB_005856 [Kipferlia bialata]|uniref:Uncharacterized protein n=1 Tax=Kipferlia bialata TaxID=797122 RepID=A0A9K3CW48_9EUKA|nr:hypothetical protein KIPB_005856 [Kipferlia bialata]|eukprot:g5856.t1